MELRLVPWASWKEWDCVRAALFSASPSRMSAAQDRISVWKSRGNVPVAVEITANLLGIRQKDPCTCVNNLPNSLPDWMLQLMYATTITRLVNGVIDSSKKVMKASVMRRAEAAGLPRLFVDIRHEASHGQLPALHVLRMAGSQAIEWLKSHYWDQQRHLLENVHEEVKSRLIDYFMRHFELIIPSEVLNKDEEVKDMEDLGMKHPKCKTKNKNVGKLRMSAQAIPEVVSILLDDNLLGDSTWMENSTECKAIKTDSDLPSLYEDTWKSVIQEVRFSMPQLVPMLVLGIARRIAGLSATADGGGHAFLHDNNTCRGHSLPMDHNLLIRWLAWFLGIVCLEDQKRTQAYASGDVYGDLLQEVLPFFLKSKLNGGLLLQITDLIAAERDTPLTKRSAALASLYEPSLKQLSVESCPDKCTYKSESRQPPETESFSNELCKLESDLMHVENQHRDLFSRKAKGLLATDKQTEDSGSKKWKVSSTWKPCAIGMLPSFCHRHGLRPPWSSTCMPGLCTESASAKNIDELHKPPLKRKLSIMFPDQDGAKQTKQQNLPACIEIVPFKGCGGGEMLHDTSVKRANDALERDRKMLHDALVKQIGDSVKPLHSSMPTSLEGCIFISGMFQQCDPEMLSSIKKEIRVL